MLKKKGYVVCVCDQPVTCTCCHQAVPNLPGYEGDGSMVMVYRASDDSQCSLCEECAESDIISYVKAYVRERISTFDADAIRNLVNDANFCSVFPKITFSDNSAYLTHYDPNSPAIANAYNQSMRRVLNNIASAGHY